MEGEGMTIYNKRRFAFYVAIPIVFISMLIVGVFVNPVFAFVGFASAIALYYWVGTFRCPKCGTKLTKRKNKAFGVEFVSWSGSLERICRECGQKLD